MVPAHAGCATDDEPKVLASTDSHVANCAFSFRREGVSFPHAHFGRAGINSGVGTNSGVGINSDSGQQDLGGGSGAAALGVHFVSPLVLSD